LPVSGVVLAQRRLGCAGAKRSLWAENSWIPLPRTIKLRYILTMSTITLRDLKRKPAKQWRKTANTGGLVVTAQGQPVAVLLPIDAKSLQPTLSALRSVRALQAQTALQEAARSRGTDKLTTEDIDAEIAAARQARRK
jgi:antitoxin (DNA-binding transcriptional repressor) of toxin-antitoxin stability system